MIKHGGTRRVDGLLRFARGMNEAGDVDDAVINKSAQKKDDKAAEFHERPRHDPCLAETVIASDVVDKEVDSPNEDSATGVDNSAVDSGEPLGNGKGKKVVSGNA